MTCFDIKTDNNVVSNGNAQVNLSTYYVYKCIGIHTYKYIELMVVMNSTVLLLDVLYRYSVWPGK